MDPNPGPFPFTPLPDAIKLHITQYSHAKDVSNLRVSNQAYQTLFNFEAHPERFSLRQRFTYLLSSKWLTKETNLKAIYDFLSTPLKVFTTENWVAELQQAIGEKLVESTEDTQIGKTILTVVTIAASIFKHDRTKHWEKRL